MAYIHIGTEKTGTSSVQKFMLDNEKALKRRGVLYPLECGYLSNFQLLWYATDNPNSHAIPCPKDLTDPDIRRQWESEFTARHQRKVLGFQAKHPSRSTVVYSSEHLQSRLIDEAPIERLKNLLEPMYDDFRIIVYLRRQDQLAVSGYSTLLRGGHTQPFTIPKANRTSHYYNYVRLLELWSNVFGKEKIIVKLYERSHLKNGDIVDDFGDLVGFDPNQDVYTRVSASNTSLSLSAQVALFRLNDIIARDESKSRHNWDKLREQFVIHIEKIQDNYSTDLMDRQSAIDFYNIFKADNDSIVRDFNIPVGFSEDFSKYPTTLPAPMPSAEQSELSRSIISDFLASPPKRLDPAQAECIHNELNPLRAIG